MPSWRPPDEPVSGDHPRRRRGLRRHADDRLSGPHLHPDPHELGPADAVQPLPRRVPPVHRRRDGPLSEPLPQVHPDGADGAAGARPEPDRGHDRADRGQRDRRRADQGVSRGGPAAALGTAALVVAVDQATKQLVDSDIARGDQVNVFFGLDLTNTRNTGVAFGALEGAGLIVAILIGLSLTLLAVYYVVNRDMPLLWLPVGLLLGGALGNLADRAREGAVIDFIDPVAWPAFNLADACIVVGVFLLLWVVEGRPKRPRGS